MRRVAVYGLGIAGQATARALAERGYGVRVGDDADTSAMHSFADEIDSPFTRVVNDSDLEKFLRGVDTLVPAPGIAPSHKVIRAACEQRLSVRSEIDLAYEWEQQRADGPRPIVGVTGTDGKTTTTMIAASLLRGGGVRTAEVGNTDTPFVAALNDDVDAFVVECSSFRLEFTQKFRASSSVWLNIAPDHLDWHGSFDSYAAAKAKLWAHSLPGDVAVAPVLSPVILDAARASQARVVTFGQSGADYCVSDGVLVSPGGELGRVSRMWRAMPHDITNSLAAVACVLEAGLVDPSTIEESLSSFVPAPHRIEFVTNIDGVDWFDDSKATSPHAALTAIRSFGRVVLIAGGRNKDLDLNEMATEPSRMVAVVAIGDDAHLIEAAFSQVCKVQRATSMTEAVALAQQIARQGDTVLLSPGCTSYDWYANYGERGNDFQTIVRALMSDERAREEMTS